MPELHMPTTRPLLMVAEQENASGLHKSAQPPLQNTAVELSDSGSGTHVVPLRLQTPFNILSHERKVPQLTGLRTFWHANGVRRDAVELDSLPAFLPASVGAKLCH